MDNDNNSSNNSGQAPQEGFLPIEEVGGVSSSAPAPEKRLRTSDSIQTQIKDALFQSGGKVKDAVVEFFVDEQLQRRKKASVALIQKIESKRRELQKAMNSGTKDFDAYGKQIGETKFTKQQSEAIKKLLEEETKLQNALTKAWSENDWTRLLELGEQKDNPPQEQKG